MHVKVVTIRQNTNIWKKPKWIENEMNFVGNLNEGVNEYGGSLTENCFFDFVWD